MKKLIVGGKKRPIRTAENTPILQLMHDAVNPVNRMKQLVHLIKTHEQISDPTLDMLNKINQSADDLNAAIDKFYNNSK